MTTPFLTISLKRIGSIVEIEGYGRSVTFYPDRKDLTFAAIVDTLKEMGEDISGDSNDARLHRNDIDRTLTEIYKAWQHDMDSRKISEQEHAYVLVRGKIKDAFKDQQGKFYAVMAKPGLPPDEAQRLESKATDKEDAFDRLQNVGNHLETMSVDSEDFDRLVLSTFYDKEKRVLSRDKRTLACDMLKAYTTMRRNLYNRIAYHEGKLYYDLHDEFWRVVIISKDGWVVRRNPLLFKRPINDPHIYGQVLPDRNYDKSRKYIRELVEKSTIAFDHQKLIDEVYTLSLFLPHIAHPMLVPYGPKGSGKSTHQGIKKLLVDPVLTPDGPKLEGLVARMPKDPKDRRVDIYDAYMIMYDNASFLEPDEMDELCTWVTGYSGSVRVLHTTDDRRAYSGKRILAINGINIPVGNADILDRALIEELEPLQGEDAAREAGQHHHIIRETVILAQIRQEMSHILGYAFDVLSRVLRRYEKEAHTIKPNHRLADFVVWGEIIARELGYPPNAFLEAWKLNVETQSLTVLRNNSLASLFIRYCFDKQPEREFVITPGELFTDLRAFAQAIGLDWYKDRSLPWNEVWLTRRLNEIVQDLKVVGLLVNAEKGVERKIRVIKDEKVYAGYQEKQDARVKASIARARENEKQDNAKQKQTLLNAFKQYLHEHDTARVHRQIFKTYVANLSIDPGQAEMLLNELIKEGKIMEDEYGSMQLGIAGQ